MLEIEIIFGFLSTKALRLRTLIKWKTDVAKKGKAGQDSLLHLGSGSVGKKQEASGEI